MPELAPNLVQFVTKGREDRHLEYKVTVAWPPRGGHALTSDQAKLVKNCLGMPNVKDGGVLVVGVDDNGSLVGLTEQQAAAFTQDSVQTIVNNYANPYVQMTVSSGYVAGDSTKWFVVIELAEFEHHPVICVRDGTDLEKGAIYTRSYGRNETAKVREGAALD